MNSWVAQVIIYFSSYLFLQPVFAAYDFYPDFYPMKGPTYFYLSQSESKKEFFIDEGFIKRLEKRLIVDLIRKYEEVFGSFDSSSWDGRGEFQSEMNFLFLDNLSLRELTEDNSRKMKIVGEYVARRALEFELDEYLRSHKKLENVYKVKEKITHQDFKVSKTSKLKINYSPSGNHADAEWSYKDQSLSYRINFHSLNRGFFTPEEKILFAHFYLDKKVQFLVYYFLWDKSTIFIFKRQMGSWWSLSLNYEKDRFISSSTERENRFFLSVLF